MLKKDILKRSNEPSSIIKSRRPYLAHHLLRESMNIEIILILKEELKNSGFEQFYLNINKQWFISD